MLGLMAIYAVFVCLIVHGTACAEEQKNATSLTQRDLYRAKLVQELQSKELILEQQRKNLAEFDKALQLLHRRLVDATGSSANTNNSDSNDNAGSGDDNAFDVGKGSLDFETMTYEATVARSALHATETQIAVLRTVIARLLLPVR